MIPRSRVDLVLRPGEYFVGEAGYRVRTVLGSCVSVTLWSPQRRIGAMSHFLLSSRARGEDLPALDARYGDEALQLMLRELALAGISPALCQAKIFGGGNMFPAHRGQSGQRGLAVGRRNGEAARSLLQAHGIAVISESLFGDGHRQVAFDIATGHVWSRQVPPESLSIDETTQAIPA